MEETSFSSSTGRAPASGHYLCHNEPETGVVSPRIFPSDSSLTYM